MDKYIIISEYNRYIVEADTIENALKNSQNKNKNIIGVLKIEDSKDTKEKNNYEY